MSDEDNNQYSGYNAKQKAAVADPKNQAFSMDRAWSNLKSGLGIGGNPQKDALARRKKVQQEQSAEAAE